MALEVISALKEFGLELDAECVQSIWDANFMLDDEPAEDPRKPNILDDENFFEMLKRVGDVCARYARTQEVEDKELWLQMQDESLDYKAILVMICFAIEIGLKRESSAPEKMCAVSAARLYIALVAINGANAYHVFTSFLFQKAIDCIRLCTRQISSISVDESNVGRRGGRGRGRGRGSNRSASRQSVQSPVEEERSKLSAEEGRDLRDLLDDLLTSLWIFVGAGSLKENRDNVKSVLVALRELFVIDGHESHKVQPTDDVHCFEILKVTEKVFACLFLLAGDKHDEGGRLVLERVVFPRLLMYAVENNRPNSQPHPPAPIMKLRHMTTDFLRLLLVDADAQLYDNLLLLIKNMCAYAPDKADYRPKVAETVALLSRSLPENVLGRFTEWLDIFAHTDKTSYRGFAVNLASELLPTAENEEARKSLVKILLKRCSDKAPTVRTRALTAVKDLLERKDHERIRTLIDCTEVLDVVDPDATVTDAPAVMDGRDKLLNLCKRSCTDDKVYVRKAAIQGLTALLNIDDRQTTLVGVLSAIQERCSDVAVVPRKCAAECLSRLVRQSPYNPLVQDAWLVAVLPLITDRESSVQELTCKLCSDVLLEKLKDDGTGWDLLTKVEQRQDSRRCLVRILALLAKQQNQQSNHVLKGIVKQLVAETDVQTHAAGAWMLLADLSQNSTSASDKARVTWHLLVDSSDRKVDYIAKIIALTAKDLKKPQAEELITDMRRKLDNFEIEAQNISSVMYAVVQLERSLAGKNRRAAAEEAVRQWMMGLVGVCEERLSRVAFVDQSSCQPTDDKLMRCYLFTLGEAIQFCPKLLSPRMVVMVEALVAEEDLKRQFSADYSQLNSNNETAPVPQQLSAAVRACAVVTLGKFCVQDEETAKKCMSILIRQLRCNSDALVRNNIMVVLSDLCLRSTSLIERHLGAVAECLKDPSTLVRKQTLTLLTVLLKEDFLRWKGVLLYRFLSTLLDPNADIRQFAEFCLVHVLQVRYPDMFSGHFLECLFSFNSVTPPTWESHNRSALHQTVNASGSFSLQGPESADDRHTLYLFMLRQLDDLKKFALMSRLCEDVLGVMAEETLELNADTQQLLGDALRVLSSKEIKLNLGSMHNQADEDDDLRNTTANTQARDAHKKLVTALQKKATMEHVVPHVASLKNLLQRCMSPLLQPLMLFLRELMKDFRNEIQEVLAADRQLAAEIEFDLNLFEQQEAAKQQQQQNEPVEEPEAQENAVPAEAPRTPARVSGPNTPIASPLRPTQPTAEQQNMLTPRPQLDVTRENILKSARKATEAATTTPTRVQRQEPDIEVVQEIANGNNGDQPDIKVNLTLADDDTGVPPRAISTPDATHMPEVTFRLGQDFTLGIQSPQVPRFSTNNSKPRRLASAETIPE